MRCLATTVLGHRVMNAASLADPRDRVSIRSFWWRNQIWSPLSLERCFLSIIRSMMYRPFLRLLTTFVHTLVWIRSVCVLCLSFEFILDQFVDLSVLITVLKIPTAENGVQGSENMIWISKRLEILMLKLPAPPTQSSVLPSLISAQPLEKALWATILS